MFCKTIDNGQKIMYHYSTNKILVENPTLVGNCIIGEPYLSGKL